MDENSSRNNDPPGLSTFQGQIERVTFYNDETDFTIARLKVSGYRELVTVVGTLMAPTPGQVVRATGEWINHPKFGEPEPAKLRLWVNEHMLDLPNARNSVKIG